MSLPSPLSISLLVDIYRPGYKLTCVLLIRVLYHIPIAVSYPESCPLYYYRRDFFSAANQNYVRTLGCTWSEVCSINAEFLGRQPSQSGVLTVSSLLLSDICMV